MASVTLTQDVEGKKAGHKAVVTAERAAFLISEGYATADDGEQTPEGVTYDAKSDPRLAANREAPGEELPKVDAADNASEVNRDVATLPADVEFAVPGPELAPEVGLNPAGPTLTPAPSEAQPDPGVQTVDGKGKLVKAPKAPAQLVAREQPVQATPDIDPPAGAVTPGFEAPEQPELEHADPAAPEPGQAQQEPEEPPAQAPVVEQQDDAKQK